jgi:hypothetical protein
MGFIAISWQDGNPRRRGNLTLASLVSGKGWRAFMLQCSTQRLISTQYFS